MTRESGFCPCVIENWLPVGEGTNAFCSNDFLLCGVPKKFRNKVFKKKIDTEALTRIESGLIGFGFASCL
jgi:hypothetical protein